MLLSEIDADLARKFKNRRDAEYKYIDKLKVQHHSPPELELPGVSLAIEAVQESPRRPKYEKNDDSKKDHVWMGRRRRTAEAFLKHTSVTVTQRGSDGSVMNISVSTSPKKLLFKAGAKRPSKGQSHAFFS